MSENEPRSDDLAGDSGIPEGGDKAAAPAGDDGTPATTGEATSKERADGAGESGNDAGERSDAGKGGDAGEKRPEGAEGKRRTRKQKVLRRTAVGAAALVLLAGAGAAGLYFDVMGGVERKNARAQLGDDRPKKLNKSLNILLLGSDSREGPNARYGAAAGMTGARSDTAILLHLSPNRDKAVGISFPRDSMVKIPSCRKEKGGTVPARFGMLNSAFAYAGPTCTWKTLETLTGIHIDHFVQIDFAGFKRVVDALDGVEICLDRPVNDPRAELFLKAGRQTVKGEDALGYVRARYSLGNGSDLERIERQQKFMASVVEKATSSEILTDPAKTYRFLKAAAKSVTTDDELDLNAMRKLAEGLRGMSAGQVRFVTVPVERYAPDPNRVQWNEKEARKLFDAIRHDNELPAEPAKPAQPQQVLPAPEKVKVTVVDAGGDDKLVKRIVKQLKRRGFDVAKKVEKDADSTESRIVYGPSAEAQASTLAKTVPDAMLSQDGNAKGDGVRLVIGKPGVRLTPPPPKKTDGIDGGVRPGQNLCK